MGQGLLPALALQLAEAVEILQHQISAVSTAVVAVAVQAAQSALFTPVQLVHSHQPTQVICNGTLYSYQRRSAI
jgi:hypothetical protein